MRTSLLVILLGCGSAQQPTPQASLVSASAPAISTAPVGVHLESPQEVCAAIIDLVTSWESGNAERAAFVGPSGVFRVAGDDVSCMAAVTQGDAPNCQTFECDADLHRCTDGERAFRLEDASDGLYLAALASDDVAIDAVWSERSRTCELFSMVRSGSIHVSTDGYRVTLEAGTRALLGEEAQITATQDAADFDTLWLECLERRCFWNYASNESELRGHLRAARLATGELVVTSRTATAPCPEGPVVNAETSLMEDCAPNGSCPSGLVCMTDENICRAGCQHDDDCVSGWQCVAGSCHDTCS